MKTTVYEGIAMRVLRLLVIALSVVSSSNAQQSSDRSVAQAIGADGTASARQYRRAAITVTKTLQLRPESASAWESRGFTYYNRKDYEKAVEAFRKAQRLAPDEVGTNNNLGFAYLFTARYQEAIASFQQALELHPRFAPAINGLCSARALAKKPGDDAVEACLNATKANPDSAVPHYFLGAAYMDRGEPDKALSALQKAVRIEPQTPRIHVGLGFASLKLKNYEEAVRHFEYARKLNAKANQALLGLGATYAQLKDYEKAEKILLQAVSSDPDDPIARFNLGMVCLVRRNRDCALSQYNRLKMMDHALAKTLFNTMFRDRVVNASDYKFP